MNYHHHFVNLRHATSVIMRVLRTPGLFLLVISAMTVFFETHNYFTINDNFRVMVDLSEHPDEYIYCKDRYFKPHHRN